MIKMEIWKQLFVVALIFTVFFVKSSFSESSVCPRRKSYFSKGLTLYYNETVCCDNFELKANQCVECDSGFYRPFDRTPEKCIPCEEGVYGKKCAFDCNCHTNEICVADKGCVSNGEATDKHTTIVSKSTNFEDTTGQSTKSTDMTSFTTAYNVVSMKNNYMMVYIASTGSMALLITVAVVCRKRIQKLKKSPISKKKRIQQNVRNVQEQQDIINFQDNGNVYNIIEERNMIEI